ncbi:hypothetical protein Kpol_1046p14 [Vanderwaltozyma polyspora DSM 70294]|uniref:Helicase ATP-binding domain-containing protein n=1 Tax=Vanderwaltozyma polyspora (strain ATCC 22028 / DSM 70294 / BCRC 21397 / CBS 2163 / NBRC 10782 / NRRL Y-8283 / UCD 57-17) TaxID=436907 RepID=A7TRJ3_VANPO|nr:uncharacterized protein Kpol_1046p14 [Vanderwaltozyma polyspora DSM 70294]EDO15122.1 hypothetical protein Kpol_1046p14 [Vanderwaltozyma polyspora DSM 70294]
MGQFQCATCNESQDAEQMMKHLSSTRHKKIEDILREEEVCCEECNDSNIHQLQIIRFGGFDMLALCNSCLDKEYSDNERPTTCYTLSNGSILKNWDNYLKVRDCTCQECGGESNLNVNTRGNILCNQCLQKKGSPSGYESDKSGKFVYLLLGIKEPNESPNRRFKKETRRKMGRGRRDMKRSNAGSKKAKKPLTIHEQMAKRAIEIKKINNVIESDSSLSLKSFKGIRATSSSTKLDTLNKKGKESRNSRSTTSSKKISTYNKSTDSISSRNSRKNSPVLNTSSKGPNNNVQQQKLPSRQKVNNTPREFKFLDSSDFSDSELSSSNISSDKGKQRNSNKKNDNSDKILSGNKQNISKTGMKSNSNVKAKPEGKQKIKTPESNHKLASYNNPERKSLQKYDIKESDEIKNRPKDSNKQKLVKTEDKRENRITKTQEDKVHHKLNDNSTSNLEEGIHYQKFLKYKPELTYNDLESYLNHFSYALFLEQKLENEYLENFGIIWPMKAQDQGLIAVLKQRNNVEVERLTSPLFKKMGRLPFYNRQCIMLCTKDESTVWYTYVKEVEAQRGQIMILLELFHWNKQPLPRKASSDEFYLLPCSAQANRIMFAMTRINNPNFIDLILGQKQIKQLDFNNRLRFSNENLNESQRSAIQHVLNNHITVLQGPPGTGKTSTIEEIIIQMIENFHSFPILCVAASNIAIDNIAEKFLLNRPNIKILRIVSEGKEPQYGPNHPLGKICLHNIVNEQLPDQMKQNLRKLRSGRINDISKNQINKLSTQQTTIADRYVSQAQIIFTTNIAAGGRQLKSIKELPVVIMDESTQSSEAATLVPLSLPGLRTFVFVGDEKQLSSFSNVPQLEMSLFERVLLNGSYKKPHMLDTQYRMHPSISKFPIKAFYNGELKDGVTIKDKEFPGIKYPLFFYNCNKGREGKVFNKVRGSAGFTYNNISEAREIVKILYKLILDKNVQRDEIGIITPYSAQRDLLSNLLVNDSVINPEKVEMFQDFDEIDLLNSKASGNTLEGPKVNTINIINGIFVSTIDSFQGHEKKFIIFSCVRNNPENKIGFVSDKRRMNVALTRAKNGLIIVGNKDVMLRGDKTWGSYIRGLQKVNLVHDNLDVY